MQSHRKPAGIPSSCRIVRINRHAPTRLSWSSRWCPQLQRMPHNPKTIKRQRPAYLCVENTIGFRVLIVGNDLWRRRGVQLINPPVLWWQARICPLLLQGRSDIDVDNRAPHDACTLAPLAAARRRTFLPQDLTTPIANRTNVRYGFNHVASKKKALRARRAG